MPHESLVFIDESGIDSYVCRAYGRAKIGQKAPGEKSGKRYARHSFVAAKCGKKILAPMTYKGTCNSTLFEKWVEKILMPELRPGQIIIRPLAYLTDRLLKLCVVTGVVPLFSRLCKRSIIVSRNVASPLKAYRKRWDSERFFRMLKTGGFNLEDSKLTHPKRMETLFLFCSIAYLLCVIVGIYRHNNVTKIRFKKRDKCYEYSYFRWGLDWMQEMMIKGVDLFNRWLFKVFTSLMT